MKLKFKKKEKIKQVTWSSRVTLAAQSYTALITVLGGVSVYIGWVYCNSYFKSVDASWITNSIGVVAMIRMSAVVIVPILMFVLIFYISIMESENKRKSVYKIDKYLVIFMVLWVLVFTILIFIFDKKLSLTFQMGFSFFISLFSATAILGLLIDLDNKKFTWVKSKDLFLNGIVVCCFFAGPNFQASVNASSDIDFLDSKLPLVKSELLPSDRSWRLLTILDNSYILVSLSENPKNRLFRILNVKEPLTIISTYK